MTPTLAPPAVPALKYDPTMLAEVQLENGASMDQPTFEALYRMTSEGFRAELVRGTVYVMASPVLFDHGDIHARVMMWLGVYAIDTRGTRALDNTSSNLGGQSEPQPDAALIVLPEFGGQTSRTKGRKVVGPAELIVEVANTSRTIDLGAKKQDYEAAGVLEYVVVLAIERSVLWFRRGPDGFAEVPPETDGSFRSTSFPGLWLNPKGLFTPTAKSIFTKVRKGLATPEHAAFVAELAARRKARKPAPRKRKA